MSKLSVKKTDTNTLVIEGPYQKTTVKKITESHYIVSIACSTSNSTVLEFIKNGKTASVLLNGKELKSPFNSNMDNSSLAISKSVMENLIPASSALDSLLLTDAVNHFQWDGVQYVSGGSGSGSIKYPHPDEDYYGVNIYNDWSTPGYSLSHSMLNYAASVAAGTLGPAGIAAIIGAVVGAAIGGVVGAAVGAIVTAIYGLYLWYFVGYQLQDENSNIWYWQSLSFLSFLNAYAWYIVLLGEYAIPWVTSVFASEGYLRIGSYTFWDALGVGNPAPPPPEDADWILSVAQYGTWGAGSVSNRNNVIGEPDGNVAQLYGGNLNDGAFIVGWTDVTSGHIYLYGYSYSGYYTHLYVYASYNNNYDWIPTSEQTVYPSSAQWIDCGSYGGTFRYIAIVAIDDNGLSARMEIDAVKVV